MNIRKIVIIIFASLTLIIFLIWLIFFSTAIANYPTVIKSRNYFDKQVTQYINSNSKNSKFNKVSRNFGVYQTDGDNYQYFFKGYFSRFDIEKGFIYLKDNSDKEYAFQLSFKKSPGNPNVGTIYYYTAEDYGAWNLKVSLISFDFTNSNLNNVPFDTNDLFRIYWTDNRQMYQITNKEDVPLNLNRSDIFSIVRIPYEIK